MSNHGQHDCPHPTCSRQVNLGTLACREHWFALPPHIRNEVWGAWRAVLAGRDGALARHDAAVAAAVAYWSAP